MRQDRPTSYQTKGPAPSRSGSFFYWLWGIMGNPLPCSRPSGGGHGLPLLEGRDGEENEINKKTERQQGPQSQGYPCSPLLFIQRGIVRKCRQIMNRDPFSFFVLMVALLPDQEAGP